MNVYAVSDLHGYPLDRFKALLDKAGFCGGDLLYIIGDVIDRNGDGGVELLRFIMAQPDFEFLLGNHENMLLACEFVFNEITDASIDELTPENYRALERYLRNGGGVTLNSLKELKLSDPGAFRDVFDFLHDAPVIGADSVNGQDFLFVHGGFRDFRPDKKLSEYNEFDLLWERPDINDEYFSGITTVLGHTPTLFYGEDYRGKVIKTPTWINIDTGAAYGERAAIIRLNDLEVFYDDRIPD